MSLKSTHNNYLVRLTYTSLLQPTEPDRLVQNFGKIFSENGVEGAFDGLDYIYSIDVNAYDQY